MWLRLWMVFSILTKIWTQQTHTRIQHGGASFEWGWQLGPNGEESATAGHYYVKLPQAEQRVRYSADNNGYHGAVAINTNGDHHSYTQNFALGQRALELNEQNPSQLYQQSNNTSQLTTHQQQNPDTPVDIYLLQQEFPSPIKQDHVQILPNNAPTLYHYSTVTNHYVDNVTPTPQYTIHTEHTVHGNPHEYESKNEEKIEKAESSNSLKKEVNNKQLSGTDVVQVFKDHNCTENDEALQERESKEYQNAIQKSKLFAEVPIYAIHEINRNLDERYSTERPLTYRGAVHFKVESPRENARSEKYYYTTEITPGTTVRSVTLTEDEGISRLVASTQDLISNEDLLRINHAAEKQVNPHNDDIIKPKSRFSVKPERTQFNPYVEPNTPRSRITVKAKIENILNSEIEHIENTKEKGKVLQTSSNEYRFASPIVVQDINYNNYKDQIVNNLGSTMMPYLQDGYEIIGIRNGVNEYNYTNKTNNRNVNRELINVTPRPIPQKYLAPITVALRLLNANDTETLNSVEDHEGSNSEQVEKTVEIPNKEKTIVEIQSSIPVDITHINAVEYHEYMEEGRSNNNGPFDFAKSLYNNYMQSLNKVHNNRNNIPQNYENTKNPDYDDKNNDYNDSKEGLESSENMQTEVQIKPNEDTNYEQNEYARDYSDYGSVNQKIIQPIVIEKEVPVTKFVDRFIEKQVPYPQPVEVVKPVPVDRPVPIPVPYEKVVEKPVEVTKYVDKIYPVEVPRPYPVEIKVPYPIEHKVFVDRPVHVPYPVEKVIEKQVVHPVPVPTPVAIPIGVPVEQKVLYPVPIETPVAVPVEVEKPVPVEKIIHREVPVPYPVEQKVPYPVPFETKVAVPYPVEKKVLVPVEKIVEKPVMITKFVEKPVHIEVPVPQPVPVAVHVRHSYPVDRIVERKVPYPVPVDRIVEKKIPIQIPYPVEKIVEKIVEKPVVVTKYVDKPYPVEKKIPYPVEKIVEKKVPYPVQVPVEVKVPYPVEKIVEKPIHVSVKVPYPVEKIIERPVAIYYGYGNGRASQSQSIPQYQIYTGQEKNIPPNQLLRSLQNQQQLYAAQYYQHIKDLKENQQNNQPVQTTNWSNLYASSYQYINHTSDQEQQQFKKTPKLINYINYVTNQTPSQYYGPPPMPSSSNSWEDNMSELKRKDRTPKVMNLRIEYGGFKPPLIPSTEVDLDGMPIKKEEDKS